MCVCVCEWHDVRTGGFFLHSVSLLLQKAATSMGKKIICGNRCTQRGILTWSEFFFVCRFKHMQTVQLLQWGCLCVCVSVCEWRRGRVHSGSWAVYVLKLAAQTGSEWAPCVLCIQPPMLGMSPRGLGSTPEMHTHAHIHRGTAVHALTLPPRALLSPRRAPLSGCWWSCALWLDGNRQLLSWHRGANRWGHLLLTSDESARWRFKDDGETSSN